MRDVTGGGAHWLVIVERSREVLAVSLRRVFDPVLVLTMVDRRLAERRGAREEVGVERRTRERRQEDSPTHRLALRGDGYLVLESRRGVSVICPECQITLEYEMPQFGEPPARITAAVHHNVKRQGGLQRPSAVGVAPLQHAVELMAYSSTGRPVLSCVVQARAPLTFTVPAPPPRPSTEEVDLPWS